MNNRTNHYQLTLLIAIISIFLLSSCETTSNYQSEAKPNLKNNTYSTFAVLPVQPGENDESKDVADAIRLGPAIEESIAAMMIAKGYERVPEAEADLNLKIIAVFQEKIEISEWDSASAIRPSYSRHSWIENYPRRELEINNYEEGSIAVEAFDTQSKEIVWVGWKEVRKPSKAPGTNKVIDFFQYIVANFPDKK